MNDVQAFADSVAQAIDAATAPLLARIAVLEKRTLVHGRDGRDGLHGKDAPAPDIDQIVARVVAVIPTPRDGRDADPVDVDLVALKAAALIPRPADGKDAPPVDLDLVAVKAAALLPVPQSGRDGKDAVVDLDLLAMKAAALVPKPADGRDAPPVDLDVIAVKAAALIPVPVAGKDAVIDMDAIALKAAALVPKPADGRDAPPVDLDVVAIKAAALVPTPAAGRDGTNADPSALASLHLELASLRGAVEAHKSLSITMPPIDSVVDASITQRLFSDQMLPAIKALVPDRSAIQADTLAMVKAAIDEALETRIEVAVKAAIAALPLPKDGEDGQSVDMEALRKAISDEVARIPVPRDGRDVDAAALELIVSAHVQKAMATVPTPRDGKSLTPEDVVPLIEAHVTKAVAALPKAIDGVGIQEAVITHEGELALTFSDGRMAKVGPVVGAPGKDADMEALKQHASEEIARLPKPKDGSPGIDGKDGLGFDDLDCAVDDDKGAVLRFARDGRVKEFGLPVVLDRGVYRPGVLYRKGSAVTAQGSLWIAQTDTRERPGDGSKSWRLAVKRGRDGRDAERQP